MLKRRIVAAVLLAMLPLFAVVSMTAIEPLAGPPAAWAYAVGMDGAEAFWYGATATVVCATIPNPGAVACGIVAGF